MVSGALKEARAYLVDGAWCFLTSSGKTNTFAEKGVPESGASSADRLAPTPRNHGATHALRLFCIQPASSRLYMAAKAGHIPDDSFNPFDGAAFLADEDEQPDGRRYVLIR